MIKKNLLFVIFILNVCLLVSCSTPPHKDIVTYNETSKPNPEIFPQEPTDNKQITPNIKEEKKFIINIYKASKESKESILTKPKGITFDSSGNLYIVDQDSNKVLKFSPNGDLSNHWGDVGSENENFKEPKYITSNNNKNIFISDTWNGRIKVYDNNGNLLNIIKEELFGPKGIHLYKNKIYVADTGNHTIKVFSMDGKLERKIGSPGKDISNLNEPTDFSFDNNGNLYIADTKNNRIAKFDNNGNFLMDWKVEGWSNPERGKECWMLFYKNKIYLSKLSEKSIDIFDTKGKSLGKITQNLDAPSGIAVYKDNLYYLDSNTLLLHKQKIL